jgi:hypothetical protein
LKKAGRRQRAFMQRVEGKKLRAARRKSSF